MTKTARRWPTALLAASATRAAQSQITPSWSGPLPQRLSSAKRQALAKLDQQAEPWRRPNYRGRLADIRGGLALATGLLAAALNQRPNSDVAARLGRPGPARRISSARHYGPAVAIGLACAAGLADDLSDGSRARGLKGHLSALTHGQVTTGLVKVIVIGAAAIVVAALEQFGPAVRPGPGSLADSVQAGPGRIGGGRRWRRLGQSLADAVLIAGSANLVNLLDLRPGRALKAACLPAVYLAAHDWPGSQLAAGLLGAAAAAAPTDLAEQTMLGDSGANALGACLGIAAVRGLSPARRGLAAAIVSGLILVSEKVSFSRIIAANPVLDGLDRLGRTE
ncbi:MAG: hypothetical protein LBJ62_08880 [Bifidobacteriaceae bacterium]|jgi:UDP-N-acetylmuramyl pentapeptide phosphotransferase/UDP-N-acetylglucosamine-1-phosphate transferase|nr:hypothetical protein [Bifidobacteriaceae bacterium]